MTLYDFNKQDLNQRMESIYDFGVYLETSISLTERCLLYGIDMFFVEVVYDLERNKITAIHSFKTGYLLDKYSFNLDVLF